MASNKTQLMAQFYEQCQDNGYTDMHNDRQSLKAKVIATDLGLHYGNIVEFYEKAAQCYRQIQAEKAKEAERLRIQRQEEQAERERRAVNGRLLVTVSGGEETLKVFLRPDNTFYCTVNDGSKIEGIPSVTVHKGGSLQYTYHPSETVFTGASSGGIMMGGTHQTEAHYTERVATSGKGYIQVSIGGTEISAIWITMSDYTQERFKRDAQFKELVSNGRIRCTKDSEMANLLTRSALTGGGDFYTQVSQLTMAADEKRLPYETCRQIAKLLGRVIHGDFPPTDEEIYEYAKKMAEGASSKELLRAIDAFRKIIDYQDTTCQLDRVQKKYEEVLQREKEQAILEKEAAKKKTAKILKISISVICAAIAVALLATKVIIPNVKYNHAISLMEAGQYEDAIAAFEAMDGFNDSLTHIVNCKIAILDTEYNSAVAMIEAGNYKEAIAQFESLGNYKDAEKRIQDTQYKWVEDLLSNKNWEEAISKLKSMGNNPVIKKRIQEAQYLQAKHLMQEEDYEAALPIFESLGNYKDAATYVEELVQLTANILRSNEIPWWTLNESKRAGYEIHSYTIQELSNGYIRCIIDCTVPIRTRVSAFNPPNGSIFMLDSKATTIGRNTVTFKIKIDILKKDPIISHSFYDTGDEKSAFFIGPEDSALCSFLKDCQ